VHSIQDPEVVEKRALPVDDQILAIRYQKDDSKYQEEEEHGDRQPEENATVSHSTENNGTSSKRKSLDDVARVPEIKYLIYFCFSIFLLPAIEYHFGRMSFPFSCLQGCI